MKNRILKNMEWGILICCIALLVIGCISLYSATQETEYEELKKQIMWGIISIPIMVVVIFIDYDIIAKFSPIFYGIFIILLIAVLFTPVVNGATSWFSISDGIKLQPSEFAKVFVIIFLAYILSIFQKTDRNQINKPWKLLILLAIVALPVLLIIKQPDYGTAIAFLIATILMLFVAGIDKKYIIITALTVVIIVPLAYQFLLPTHAKKRIDVFLNPNLDSRGSRIQCYPIKISHWIRAIIWNGITKRKPNTAWIFTS